MNISSLSEFRTNNPINRAVKGIGLDHTATAIGQTTVTIAIYIVLPNSQQFVVSAFTYCFTAALHRLQFNVLFYLFSTSLHGSNESYFYSWGAFVVLLPPPCFSPYKCVGISVILARLFRFLSLFFSYCSNCFLNCKILDILG